MMIIKHAMHPAITASESEKYDYYSARSNNRQIFSWKSE